MRPHSQAEIRRQRHGAWLPLPNIPELAPAPPPPLPVLEVGSGRNRQQCRIEEQNIYNPELHQQSRALQQQGKSWGGKMGPDSSGLVQATSTRHLSTSHPTPTFWEDPCGAIRAAETHRLSIWLQGKFWGFRSSGPAVLSAFSLSGADTTEILWKQPNTPHSMLEACPAQGELHC